MAARKRYLIASSAGLGLDAASRRALDAFLAAHPEVSALQRTPAGRYRLEMTEAERGDLAAKLPRLIIEEDQGLLLFPMPGLPQPARGKGTFSLQVAVRDSSSGRPIPEATIIGVGDGVSYRAVT